MPSSHARFPLNHALIALALAGTLALAACGGDDGAPGNPGATGSPGLAALNNISVEAMGTNCPTGGTRIDAGIDANANATLDASEVSSTQYLCNGSTGPIAHASLVRLSAEPAGAHCASGGSRVDAGVDANANGVLDAGEVSTTAYVCGSANGSTGATGPAGPAGTTGTSRLTTIASEAAGSNCPVGGQRVTTGPDGNANGVLDAGEVATTTYLCHGAAGASLQWVTVTASTAQTQPNTGYITTSATQATLTLPSDADLKLGDVVRVSGNGSGGWRLAQNSGQVILTGGLPVRYETITEAFTNFASSGVVANWRNIAMSDDGRRLAAVNAGYQLHTSNDAGATWIVRLSGQDWSDVASSADGLKLVAASHGGQLYTSTDGGLSWTARDIARGWSSVASSADGGRLVASTSDGFTFVSIDSGVSWTLGRSDPLTPAVAISSDGTVVTSTGFGKIYTSTDDGVTWSDQTVPLLAARDLAVSDDGKVIAVSDAFGMYLSTNYGASWQLVPTLQPVGLAISSDGRRIVTAGTGLDVSDNSGSTWTQRDSVNFWNAVTMSRDGTRIAAGEFSGRIHLARQDRSTVGTAGSLVGGPFDTIELQYVGPGQFAPLSFNAASGSFTAY